MPVVGDVAAMAVDDPAREMLGRGALEGGRHVRDLVGRRIDAVPPPHHHRHVAELAVGDPAHVVLVMPLRKAGGLAQVTVGINF